MGNKNKAKKIVVTGKTESTPAARLQALKESMGDKPFELRFSPTAWAKLLYMRDIGGTEIGGFGVTKPDDLLYVEDFVTVKQECTSAHVEFDDQDVSDFTLDMVEEGLQPENFLRIWIHTHPNISPEPSQTDEDTFARVFGKCDWAVMAILSKDERTYCRLQVNGGPVKGSVEIPMEVDFTSYEFVESDFEAWTQEYERNVTRVYYQYHTSSWYNSVPGYNGRGFPGYNGGASRSALGDVQRGEDEYNLYGGWGPYSGSSTSDKSSTTVSPKSDDAHSYSYTGNTKQNSKKSVVIPSDIEKHIDANTMILLQYMTEFEQDYIFDEVRSKYNVGD